MKDLTLLRVDRDKVEDVDFPVLADAMDATHPLFQTVGVPRHVVVDHQMAELQVHALASGVRCDADLHLLVEDAPAFLPVYGIVAAVDGHGFVAPGPERPIKMLQRVTMLSENEELASTLRQLSELGLVQALLELLELGLDRRLGISKTHGLRVEPPQFPDLAPQALHGFRDHDVCRSP